MPAAHEPVLHSPTRPPTRPPADPPPTHLPPASDLMWREIRELGKTKPVIASMADVAASGGYYMVSIENVKG